MMASDDRTLSDRDLALVLESQAIEAESAKAAGKLSYMPQAMVQATMPHGATTETVFRRRNGAYTLTMLADPEVGLPYGSMPRLLLIWLTTEAVKTKSRDLVLGETLSSFMQDLELVPTGGRWGTITKLRTQMERLFSCHVSCRFQSDEHRGYNVNIANEYRLWWDPKRPHQAALWQSSVALSTDFFNEIVKAPIPLDMRAVKVLRRSALALDIYGSLTHRLSYLDRKLVIPWVALALQFGSDYKVRRQFKRAFLDQLRHVLAVYPEAKVEVGENGLILKPSRPHVPRLKL